MTSRRASPVLVGREAELSTLGDAFEAAGAGRQRLVLVGAEAGGGKSRLVAEFTAQVKGRARVLAGECVDLGAAGLPYAPFTAALRKLVREQGAAEVTGQLPGGTAGEIESFATDGITPRLSRSPPFPASPPSAAGAPSSIASDEPPWTRSTSAPAAIWKHSPAPPGTAGPPGSPRR